MFFAYAVVTQDAVVRFIDTEQLDDTVRRHIGTEIEILPYTDFFSYLRDLSAKAKFTKENVSHSYRRHSYATQEL